MYAFEFRRLFLLIDNKLAGMVCKCNSGKYILCNQFMFNSQDPKITYFSLQLPGRNHDLLTLHPKSHAVLQEPVPDVVL